jgi:hypothetical protein
MKKLLLLILLIPCLAATLATAQTRLPAKQVTVVTTNWTNLSPSNNTAQSLFDFLDKAINENFNLAETNFVRVNTNTYFTAKAFLTLASAFGVTNFSSGVYSNVYSDLVESLEGFEQMNTNFANLPTNLVFNSPNLLVDLSDDLLGSLGEAINGIVFEEEPEFYVPVIKTSATNVLITYTNGSHQYLDVTTNTTIFFDPPPSTKSHDLYVWVRGNTNYTIAYDTDFVALDTNAPDLSNTNLYGIYRYYNSPFESKWYEAYAAPEIEAAAPPPPPITGITASGGSVIISGLYRVHTFNSDGTFNVTAAPTDGQIEVLVVGGGGGGGNGIGGGGGGGAVKLYTIPITNGSFSVDVGDGGSAGAKGSQSSITVFGAEYSAEGGGAGGQFGPGGSGGSGGGGSGVAQAGGSGNDGRSGGGGSYLGSGGGGGMDSAGANGPYSSGGNGGSGYSTTFRQSPAEVFGGGGGGGGRDRGGSDFGDSPGTGGSGGGGNGGINAGNEYPTDQHATSGTANTGGGGGGGGFLGSGASGGSGVVIIRYLD